MAKEHTAALTSKILALILFVLLVGLFAKFGQPGFLAITGAQVTSLGNTSVTLAGTVSINLDDSSASFGAGFVNVSFTQANISTDGGRAGWVNTSGLNFTDPMHILNNGTAPANVTLYATNSSALFIGGTGPAQNFRAANDEASSCGGTLTSAWTNLSLVEYIICSNLGYIDASDTLLVYFNLTIPNDAPAGVKTNSITFTARLATQ